MDTWIRQTCTYISVYIACKQLYMGPNFFFSTKSPNEENLGSLQYFGCQVQCHSEQRLLSWYLWI